MAKFHINPTTGEPGKCSAKSGGCPFAGEDQHFASPAEARQAFEASNSEATLQSVGRRITDGRETPENLVGSSYRGREGTLMTHKATLNSPQLQTGVLHLAKLPPLKSLDAQGLHRALLNEAAIVGLDVEKLDTAAKLAFQLHEGQFRRAAPGEKRPPYITHPLRNAVRLIRWGVRDTDQVVMGVFHDTVEDCPEKFCDLNGITYTDEQDARTHLLKHIEDNYGARVARAVNKLSHPVESKEARNAKPIEQKNEEYADGVAQATLNDLDVFLNKTSDMHDNGAGLRHTDFESSRRQTVKQGVKYLGTVPKLRDSFASVDIQDPMLYSSVAASLDLIEARLLWIVSK